MNRGTVDGGVLFPLGLRLGGVEHDAPRPTRPGATRAQRPRRRGTRESRTGCLAVRSIRSRCGWPGAEVVVISSSLTPALRDVVKDGDVTWEECRYADGDLTVAVSGGGDPRRAVAVRDAILACLAAGTIPDRPHRVRDREQ